MKNLSQKGIFMYFSVYLSICGSSNDVHQPAPPARISTLKVTSTSNNTLRVVFGVWRTEMDDIDGVPSTSTQYPGPAVVCASLRDPAWPLTPARRLNASMLQLFPLHLGHDFLYFVIRLYDRFIKFTIMKDGDIPFGVRWPHF